MSDSSTTIRRAEPRDVEVITAVVAEAFTPYVERIGVVPWPMQADYAVLVAAGDTWVACAQDDDVCGVVVLEPHDEYVLLDIIAVADKVRGQGVGAALMRHAEDRARATGRAEVRLYTNELMTENLAYYPRLGYVETHRATFAEIYHRVFFTKHLD